MTSLIQLDKMLINCFANSAMLVMHQKLFKTAIIKRIYWLVSFQTNVKDFPRNIRRSWSTDKHDHFFLLLYLYQACFVKNILEKVVDLTTLNILRTQDFCNFCFINTLRCQILIWLCKVFCLFQQIFPCEKVKSNIITAAATTRVL